MYPFFWVWLGGIIICPLVMKFIGFYEGEMSTDEASMCFFATLLWPAGIFIWIYYEIFTRIPTLKQLTTKKEQPDPLAEECDKLVAK